MRFDKKQQQREKDGDGNQAHLKLENQTSPFLPPRLKSQAKL